LHELCAPRCVGNRVNRCAIMFEVVRDWNYAQALIALKALSIRTSGTAGAIECTLKALSPSPSR